MSGISTPNSARTPRGSRTARVFPKAGFPGHEARYFTPISIGDTPESAEAGADLILAGIKTATASSFWEYPDGRIPFRGALSVLLDGKGRPRGIVETDRVAIMPFGSLDRDFARAYGEGERTVEWFRCKMGAWYRKRAAIQGTQFSDDSSCEWITLVQRL